MTYYHNDHAKEFLSAVDECSFTGDNSMYLLDTLTGRVQRKRLKTVTRLLASASKLGCIVEFCSEKDDDKGNQFVDEYKNANGMYSEDDSWIYINLDKIGSWAKLEKTLAHEAVHLAQNVVFREERKLGESSMDICMDRVWACYNDPPGYRDYLESESKEEYPVFEVEAYGEMRLPKAVARSLEILWRKPDLWEGTYYCPVT